jgi:hypothetical protein
MSVVPRIDEYAGRVAEFPSCLADLSDSRQKRWMWGWLPRWSREDISEYVVTLAQAKTPCYSMWSLDSRRPAPRRGIPLARLGDDGLYHLVSDAGLWCGSIRRTSAIGPDMKHVLASYERVPKWWGDGRRGEWPVTLTNVTRGPELVPYGLRCPLPPRFGTWAAYSGGKSPEMRIRSLLIEASGRACEICGVAPGVFVDHDHFSGMVRGLHVFRLSQFSAGGGTEPSVLRKVARLRGSGHCCSNRCGEHSQDTGRFAVAVASAVVTLFAC